MHAVKFYALVDCGITPLLWLLFLCAAEADVDFRIRDTSVTFEPGDVETTMEIDLLDDVWTEPLKAIKVSFLPPLDAEISGYSYTIISILDGDGKPILGLFVDCASKQRVLKSLPPGIPFTN